MFLDPQLLPKDPLLASEGTKSAHLFHPHGAYTNIGDTSTLTLTPYTPVTPANPSGKINTRQQSDSIPTLKSFLEMNLDLLVF